LPSKIPPFAPHSPHPALVLGVYGEELAHGARTAVFGDATLGVAEELSLRGARLVHVYDTDAARVAEANARSHDRSIFFAQLPEGGDVGVRDGAFEFVVVPDLSLYADPAAIVALARRLVSPLGAVLIASPNADAKAPLLRVAHSHRALGYYELYEAIAGHFASVRMIGQAPFVGYAVAELSVEDPEPTIDSSLAESEGKEPDWFLALASDRNLRLDAFALIELPPQVLANVAVGEANDNVLAGTALETAGGSGTVLINILEAEREAALESLRQQEQALDAERIRADRALQELSAAREEVDLLRERCRSLDERASELDARVSDVEARRSTAEAHLEKTRLDPEPANLRERVRAAEERLRASEERALSAEARLRAADERARVSEERVRVSEERARSTEERARKLEAAALRAAQENEAAQELEAESAKLEAQLRERGREIQELRAEVDRRDKLVRELVMTNFPAHPSPSASATENGSEASANGFADKGAPSSGETEISGGGHAPALVADLSARLDRLASDAARREADLVGARWRIAQLERELTQR
jgi:hypothetical protein